MARRYEGLDLLTEKPLSFLDALLLQRPGGPIDTAIGLVILGGIFLAILAGGYILIPLALARSFKKSWLTIGQGTVDKVLVPGLDLLLNLLDAPECSRRQARRAELLERIRREDGQPLKLPEGWPEA